MTSYELRISGKHYRALREHLFPTYNHIEQGAYLREGKADAITTIWDPRGSYAVDAFTAAKLRLVDIPPEDVTSTPIGEK